MELLQDPQTWVALLTLTALEIVLGVDNIIFISILAGKLPKEQQNRARRVGLALAMGMRILLLLSLAWVIRLTNPLFTVFGEGISGRDLILLLGGLFLIFKATHEMHDRLEGEENEEGQRVAASFGAVLVQIALLDIVFSLDSVITAVGLVNHVPIMATAIIIAVAVMLLASDLVGNFIDRHPTIKMLALAFIVLVGIALIADGLDFHIPRGYMYSAMLFSAIVEALNLVARNRSARRAR